MQIDYRLASALQIIDGAIHIWCPVEWQAINRYSKLWNKSAVKRRSTLGGLDQYTTPNAKLNTLEMSAPPKKTKKQKQNKLHRCDVM